MGISKDQRIKKLRKTRIWPSVVGLILIVIIFMTLITAVFALSVDNIIQTKFGNAERISTEIARLFEGYGRNDESRDGVHETASACVHALPEIEDIYVTDMQSQYIWSCNGGEPNKDEMMVVALENSGSETNRDTIIKRDETGVFEYSSEIGEDNLSEYTYINIDKINYEELFERMENIEQIGIYTRIVDISIWYELCVDDHMIYVLNSIPLYFTDLIGILGMAVVFAILILVFVIYYIISFVGVVRREHRTTKIIYTDMITGGNNWFYFIKKGNALLKRNHGRKNYAVVHLCMHKYHSFCTCFGVKRGEQLIELFYQVLRKRIKRGELIAYHENAQFGVVLIYSSREELTERLEELEHALKESAGKVKLYFGFGICLAEAKQYDVEVLYHNAYTACELHADDSDHKITFFDEEMKRQRLWERKVEDDMERALAAKEFKVYLQPKISASEEKLAGAEALVRWIHPQEGFIPPNKFIPIFESNGFILKLDDYMIEEVARQQADWIAQGRTIVPISVNVSRAHFTREDLAEHICEIVDRFGVPHNCIELELTESAFFDDKKVLLRTVKKLRDSGFTVSMDDFGAGYSSLNSLKELTIDVLKIDADFFRNVEEVERGMLIVSEVIDLAKKLNMKIVAEGIESRDQVDFLVQQECDLIQGYFFAKPMPVEEFVEKYSD